MLFPFSFQSIKMPSTSFQNPISILGNFAAPHFRDHFAQILGIVGHVGAAEFLHPQTAGAHQGVRHCKSKGIIFYILI